MNNAIPTLAGVSLREDLPALLHELLGGGRSEAAEPDHEDRCAGVGTPAGPAGCGISQ